jgi:uncharacterized protein YdhG (YjbR/CyaY superfamily)
MKNSKNTNEYLKNVDKDVLPKFLELRKISLNLLSKYKNIEEEIKYGIPTFVWKEGKKTKNLFHIGAFKTHVSLFPGSQAIEFFKKDLEKFVTSKGTIKFLLTQKLPGTLVKKIIKFCITNSIK